MKKTQQKSKTITLYCLKDREGSLRFEYLSRRKYDVEGIALYDFGGIHDKSWKDISKRLGMSVVKVELAEVLK